LCLCLPFYDHAVERKATNYWPLRIPTPPIHNPPKARPISNSAGRKCNSVLAFAGRSYFPAYNGCLRRLHASVYRDQRSQSSGHDCRLESVSDELSSASRLSPARCCGTCRVVCRLRAYLHTEEHEHTELLITLDLRWLSSLECQLLLKMLIKQIRRRCRLPESSQCTMYM
jgi:hypothetical protein